MSTALKNTTLMLQSTFEILILYMQDTFYYANYADRF